VYLFTLCTSIFHYVPLLQHLVAHADCSVCASGYTASTGHRCFKCSNSVRGVIVSVLAAVAAVGVGTLLYIFSDLFGYGDMSNACSLCHVITRFSAAIFKLPWQHFKIPIVTFQILVQYINITGLKLPSLYSTFVSWLEVFSVNLGWLLSLGCINSFDFYDKLLVSTLSPIAVTLVLACTYACLKYQQIERFKEIAAKHYLVFLVMTYLIYSTVSTVVFQTFACDTLEATGVSYLRADYSMQCNTALHTKYRVFSGVY
jgi:hypothetical protein